MELCSICSGTIQLTRSRFLSQQLRLVGLQWVSLGSLYLFDLFQLVVFVLINLSSVVDSWHYVLSHSEGFARRAGRMVESDAVIGWIDGSTPRYD
jgi:hypothetical protein